MKKRSIKRVLLGQDIQMGSVHLKQPLPLGQIEQVDPFLLIHHLLPVLPQAGEKPPMDVAPHPHRGFEPVTFIFKGAIHHRDSRGNDSIIKAGGVQWMTAGMGIVHSESIPKASLEDEIEIIQLWINLPARLKSVQPRYQGFQASEIPIFSDQNNQVKVQVIAGLFKNLTGPVDSLTGVRALTLNLKKGATLTIEEPADRNAILYQLSGITAVNGVTTGDHKLVVLNQDGAVIDLKAETDSVLLYLSGTPIGEKVTQYGPYVMNTQTEIMEAMRDYKMGKMGILI